MRLFAIVCALLLATAALPAGDGPSADEQAAMITAMRDYAADYLDAMPNFVCTRVVEHYQSGLKHIHWHGDGKEVAELSVVGGQEHTKRLAPGKAKFPLITEGEFGAMLTQIFNPASETEFSWSGWESLESRRVATFHFAVAREHSTKVISNFGVRAKLPYHGTVWADPANGVVLRVRQQSEEIPDELQVEETETTIEYRKVAINGHESMLPVRAITQNKTTQGWVKNDVQFSDYREFQADSKITFGPPSQP